MTRDQQNAIGHALAELARAYHNTPETDLTNRKALADSFAKLQREFPQATACTARYSGAAWIVPPKY